MGHSMIGSTSVALSVVEFKVQQVTSIGELSVCPVCLLCLLSATNQVFTDSFPFLSDRTSKASTTILLQLAFTPISPLGLPAYHLQSLQRRGAKSGSTCRCHSAETNHLLGPLLTHVSK